MSLPGEAGTKQPGAVATLRHPALAPEEFAAAMSRSGWRAPMELIDGEVVVIPPS